MGITTLVVILLAWTLGLNQVASQIGVHAMTPFHLLLFIPFIELGVHPFHTRRLPLSRHQIEHLSHHPWRLVRDIWQWEWRALIRLYVSGFRIAGSVLNSRYFKP